MAGQGGPSPLLQGAFMLATLQKLSARYPFREEEIEVLLKFVAQAVAGRTPWDEKGVASSKPLLLCGTASTGKTAITRSLLSEVGFLEGPVPRAAWVDCRTLDAGSWQSLLRSVYSQLGGRKRSRPSRAAAKVDRRSIHETLGDLAEVAPAAGERRLVVLDNVQLVKDPEVLPALLRVRELTQDGVNVCFLLLGQWQAPDVPGLVSLTEHLPAHRRLWLPLYDPAQLKALLVAAPPEHAPEELTAALWEPYVGIILSTFHRATSELPLLKAIAHLLWPEYLAPGKAELGSDKQSAQNARGQLYENFKPRLKEACRSFEEEKCAVSSTQSLKRLRTRPASHLWPARKESGAVPAFTRREWLMLLAAHLCAWNRPQADARLFSGKRANKLRGLDAANKQAEAVQAARLRGPQPFDLNRLLAVYAGLGRTQGLLEDRPPGEPSPSLEAPKLGGKGSSAKATGSRGGAASSVSGSSAAAQGQPLEDSPLHGGPLPPENGTALCLPPTLVETRHLAIVGGLWDNPHYVSCIDDDLARVAAAKLHIELEGFLVYV